MARGPCECHRFSSLTSITCVHTRGRETLSAKTDRQAAAREKKKESILKQSGVLSKMRLRLLLSANSRPAQSKINKNPSHTHRARKENIIGCKKKKAGDIDQTDAQKKKDVVALQASGNIDCCTTTKRGFLFNQIRFVVVTTPTRRQRRYVFLKRMSYERCQQVPRQSERAPIIISDFREEIQIDTTEKSLTQCAADQVSCFDFLSQVDRMTVVVPVHNKMSVPVSSLYQKHTNYLSAMPVAGHRCVSDSSTTQFHLSLSITPLFFHISLWIRLSQVYHSFRLKIPKKQTGERKRNPVVMFLHGKGAAKQKY